MVSYKEIGLVNTREMFAKAVAGGYAIPAFNFNNMEQLQAIIQASAETKSPVILQVSKGARNYANQTLLRYMAEGAVEYAKELGWEHPQIVLHLDHGDSFETCKSCVDMGFSSVMIDASALPFEENIALTKKVVDYAHQFDVTVEAELGVLAGVEDEVASEKSHYTKPSEVIEFATRSGCDSLAISIGTSHGAYKFTKEQCTIDPKTGRLVPPPLAFDILHEIEKKLPGFPIVLHGSSSVPQEYVDIINEYGGNLPDAVGIPEEQLREAAKSAVCKINIDSDSRLAMTAAVRKIFHDKPGEFDPRKYLGPARDEMKKLYMHKIVNVLGSDGKALEALSEDSAILKSVTAPPPSTGSSNVFASFCASSPFFGREHARPGALVSPPTSGIRLHPGAGKTYGQMAPGGLVHPRTRVGGGARWIQVPAERGRRRQWEGPE